MDIPESTKEDIEEMKKRVPFKLSKDKEQVYESFVIINKCFGEIALNDVILEAKRKYNIN